MKGLIEIPILSIASLSSESAVNLIRKVLRAECRYSRLSPSSLTISSRLTVADGGIDAEVNSEPIRDIPADCIFRAGLNGIQIKAGTAFKPWTVSSIKGELLNSKGKLDSEVERLVNRSGYYILICTGHDLTPEQRNEAKGLIASIFAQQNYPGYEGRIEVFGASQLVEFVERYPGVASFIIQDPIQEAWVLEEWQRDAHMSNPFEVSKEQDELIREIQRGLLGERKHIRVLGEPGLGKTRVVLEALRNPDLASLVLYIPSGLIFGQTRLFRQLLKAPCDKPLILVIDELPESELTGIWRHLKTRCGALKIVSMDHGRDETRDEDIERLYAPKLTEETIKQILVNRLGESRELDRWVAICEGSPRVAQAVAENLRANPDDLLRSPSEVPIWERFLHGYGRRDEQQARQVDCVTQHLALFSRFGYEHPVSQEARHIAQMIEAVDPTIGWARFQEIVKSLRSRRVLQGSKTLFFVPKALHIYLWKRFWENYGREFHFTDTFAALPESLHFWFMNMFKYAADSSTKHVIDEILKPEGIYSEKAILTSAKGTGFLSTLAEANPSAVLRLLEATLGQWTDEEIKAFTEHRQNIVWTLEKIAVWTPLTVRALRLLARLAVNETATNSNNATGILAGLFRIGPEWAATEATPQQRLPAALELLRSDSDSGRDLGLRCITAALDTSGLGMRMIGPEFQGLKVRAKLWIPKTYGDWWDARHTYFQTLIEETQHWPDYWRPKVCSAWLEAFKHMVKLTPCKDLALQILEILANDPQMDSSEINSLFSDWPEYHHEDGLEDITKRIAVISRHHIQSDIGSRFQRYVIDVDWLTWDEEYRDQQTKSKNRAKSLVDALAKRITRQRNLFEIILPFLAPKKGTPALWYFGQQLALNDIHRELLPPIVERALDAKHWVCLGGYLDQLRLDKLSEFRKIIHSLIIHKETAWLGAYLTLHLGNDEQLFDLCLDALESGWIKPGQFSFLRFGHASNSVPPRQIARLLEHLHHDSDDASLGVLIGLLTDLPFTDISPFTADFVYEVLVSSLADEQRWSAYKGYNWSKLSNKLIEWNPSLVLSLLDSLLAKMGNAWELSYDFYVAPLASNLVKIDPNGAWQVVHKQFEASLPKWRSDLQNWLKGGIGGFHERETRSPIADLPMNDILAWVEEDPENRAGLIAHAPPKTLDDENGGRLTRELIIRYSNLDGVKNGISANFHSGGWSGPTSEYLKRKRDCFRGWLSADFHFEVTQWIESEIEYLDERIVHAEIEEERSRFE